MKICFKCGVEKPLAAYYKHPKMADGHLNKYKVCTKADSNKHRAENLEAVKAYDRSRGDLPHRVAARAAYAKTDEGRMATVKGKINYVAAHPDRYAANTAIGNAVRDGRIVPWPACAIPDCSSKPEAHHPDYSRPLDVVWLCVHHHKQAHKLGRELKRMEK